MLHIDIRNLQSARMLRDIPATFLVGYFLRLVEDPLA
jgi:hypothetical protein